MKEQMKQLSIITKDDLISYLGGYAKIIIKHTDSAYNLLVKLNWDEGISKNSKDEIGARMLQLFGVSYEKAEITYSSFYLDDYYFSF